MYLLYTIGTVHTVCVSSRAQGQPQAKIVVAIVWVVVVPIRTSGVIRIVVPAATAFDTVRTGSSTLLMSLPFNTLHYQ